jgi:4a-hydroxytetrahydrobiopterin dehydratase
MAEMHCTPVTAASNRLSGDEVASLKSDLAGWEIADNKSELHLEKSFKFENFTKALAFTTKVGKIADEEDHHPAILTEWGKVTVTWWTHRIKGLSKNDFIMAAKTDRLAS